MSPGRLAPSSVTRAERWVNRSLIRHVEKRLLTNNFYCCIQTFRVIRETFWSLTGRLKPKSLLLRMRLSGARQMLGRPAKAVWDSWGNGSERNHFAAQIN